MAGSVTASCHTVQDPWTKEIITEDIEAFSDYNFDILVITEVLHHFDLLNVIYINQWTPWHSLTLCLDPGSGMFETQVQYHQSMRVDRRLNWHGWLESTVWLLELCSAILRQQTPSLRNQIEVSTCHLPTGKKGPGSPAPRKKQQKGGDPWRVHFLIFYFLSFFSLLIRR